MAEVRVIRWSLHLVDVLEARAPCRELLFFGQLKLLEDRGNHFDLAVLVLLGLGDVVDSFFKFVCLGGREFSQFLLVHNFFSQRDLVVGGAARAYDSVRCVAGSELLSFPVPGVLHAPQSPKTSHWSFLDLQAALGPLGEIQRSPGCLPKAFLGRVVLQTVQFQWI